jgi:hypothetical protein
LTHGDGGFGDLLAELALDVLNPSRPRPFAGSDAKDSASDSLPFQNKFIILSHCALGWLWR